MKAHFVVAVGSGFWVPSYEIYGQEHFNCLSVWFIVWLHLVLFELFISWLGHDDQRNTEMPE